MNAPPPRRRIDEDAAQKVESKLRKCEAAVERGFIDFEFLH
jgi:hypothetical protein